EPLEIRLAFPEFHPRIVGAFELEVGGDVGRDLVDGHLPALDVDEKRRVAIGACENDFRGDRRGFLPPPGIRVEATRDFLEAPLGLRPAIPWRLKPLIKSSS